MVDAGFVRRLERDTAWFSIVVCLFLSARGYDWPVWGGVLAGVAIALGTLLLFEGAVAWSTSPGRQARPEWLGLLGVLLTPVLAGALYLCIPVAGLDGAAIAGGVTLPMLVGLLKALGVGWQKWAAGVGSEGAHRRRDE